uniref:30S ribosomal protein S10, chloroplastic n=1 Tax=Bangiopsis subsimplex TaxID=139980 RepID=A0A1C9CD13_9RHOD|nr:ribosomal protein S10 [Bangiopsis subsimplex]AOM66247.1 ribosomal protein S10 [Bangiopsis subsimplex]ARO90391.1 30S ribosomal protein S10 [Bangiopsis subsimplex]
MISIPEKKFRIRLSSYNYQSLNISCSQILDTVVKTNGIPIGPIPLPTKRRIYCVLRSPHVDKASREHFEIRTHSRIIDIYQTSSELINQLMKLELSTGVDIEVQF